MYLVPPVGLTKESVRLPFARISDDAMRETGRSLLSRMKPNWWADAAWPPKAGYMMGVAAPPAVLARAIQRRHAGVPDVPGTKYLDDIHNTISGAKSVRRATAAIR